MCVLKLPDAARNQYARLAWLGRHYYPPNRLVHRIRIGKYDKLKILTIRQRLYRFYEKAEGRIVPGLRYSQLEYVEILQEFSPGCRWLDLGCGHQIIPDWMGDTERAIVRKSALIVGADMDVEGIKRHRSIRDRVIANFELAPFRSETFDLITANMVMEHVSNPVAALREIGRMLKPGGRFIFHTPNFRSIYVFPAVILPQKLKNRLIRLFESREEHDAFPTLYRINTPRAIHQKAKEAGFGVVDIRLLNNSARYVMLGPVAIILELLMLKLLMLPVFRSFRSNMIGILEKTAGKPY